MMNLSANRKIVESTKSLLTDNYPLLKHPFQMLETLNNINEMVLSDEASMIKIDEYRRILELLSENINDNEFEYKKEFDENFDTFNSTLLNREFEVNQSSYHVKYVSLRWFIVRIYETNMSKLESKYGSVYKKTLEITYLQQKVGINGLTLLVIFIVLIPLFIINPIKRISERMLVFYKKYFDKDIQIKANNELEKLEEIFEKIVLELKQDNNGK